MIIGIIASGISGHLGGTAYPITTGAQLGTPIPYSALNGWRMVYGGGNYVYQTGGAFLISTNGTSFTQVTTPATSLNVMAPPIWNGTVFVATGSQVGNTAQLQILTSPTGATWTTYNITVTGAGTTFSLGYAWGSSGYLGGYMYFTGYSNTSSQGGIFYSSTPAGPWTFNGHGGNQAFGGRNNGSYLVLTGNNVAAIKYLTNPAGSWTTYTLSSATNGVGTGTSGSGFILSGVNLGVYWYSASSPSSWSSISTSSYGIGWAAGNGSTTVASEWGQAGYHYGSSSGNSLPSTATWPGFTGYLIGLDYAGSYYWMTQYGSGMWRIPTGSPGTATQVSVSFYNKSPNGYSYAATDGAGTVLLFGYDTTSTNTKWSKITSAGTVFTDVTPTNMTGTYNGGTNCYYDSGNGYYYTLGVNSGGTCIYYTNNPTSSTWSNTSAITGTQWALLHKNGYGVMFEQGTRHAYWTGTNPTSITYVDDSAILATGFNWGAAGVDSSGNYWSVDRGTVNNNKVFYVTTAALGTLNVSATLPTPLNTTYYWAAGWSTNGYNFIYDQSGTYYAYNTGAVTSGGWTTFTPPGSIGSAQIQFGKGSWIIGGSTVWYSAALTTWTQAPSYPTDNFSVGIAVGAFDGTVFNMANYNSTNLYIA